MTSVSSSISKPGALSDDLLLTYYGDDFSGSTDVMEVLTKAGLPTALFVDPPSLETLASFPSLRAFGVAGRSRSLETSALNQELPPILSAIRAHRSALFHFKICSTFDSSPEIGNIGKSIEHCRKVFSPEERSLTPLLVGAPTLNRFCVFGNLFARSGPESEVFRLDRHPTMSRHPATPMQESDLRRHLSRQSNLAVGLIDILDLERGEGHCLQQIQSIAANGGDIVLYDSLTPAHQLLIGSLLWMSRDTEDAMLLVGSSGIEYALTDHWRQAGLLPEPPRLTVGAVDRLLVISGSCSPVTDRQIAWAIENGFVEIALDPIRLLDTRLTGSETKRAADTAVASLRDGRSVVIHLCRGPNDPRIEQFRRYVKDAAAGSDRVSDVEKLQADGAQHQYKLSSGLGDVARLILDRCHAQKVATNRVVVAGGDTSGVIARRIGIEALEMIASMAPGSPLCKVRSQRLEVDGLEVLFKGGQVGPRDLFGHILAGTSEGSFPSPRVS